MSEPNFHDGQREEPPSGEWAKQLKKRQVKQDLAEIFNFLSPVERVCTWSTVES